ncbi:MAG: phosphotransferase [Candidatus Saccharibacteria bacterium]
MDFIRSNYTTEQACDVLKDRYALGDIVSYGKLSGVANDNYRITGADFDVALKIYSHGQSNRDKIAKEIEAVKLFMAAGIDIPEFVLGKDGQILQEYDGFNVVATNFIDGPVLDELEFAPELMKQVGQVVATIDQTAQQIDVSQFSAMNFCEEFDFVYGNIDQEMANKGLQFDMSEYKSNLPRVYEIIDKLDSSNNQQFLHKDIWPWNLIQNGGRLYLLDFNDWAIGDPIIEISVALVEFSMFKSDRFNGQVAAAIIDGYKNKKQFNFTASELLDAMLFICYLYFPYNVIQADSEEESRIYLERIHTLLNEDIGLDKLIKGEK